MPLICATVTDIDTDELFGCVFVETGDHCTVQELVARLFAELDVRVDQGRLDPEKYRIPHEMMNRVVRPGELEVLREHLGVT